MSKLSARPDSASSRSAWDLDGDREESYPAIAGARHKSGHGEITGVEMTPASSGTIAHPEDVSLLAKFQRGIRSIWATRLTEDSAGNSDILIKTTLRELIIYGVFLILLCVMTFGMTSTTTYYYTTTMDNTFLRQSGSGVAFSNMRTMGDIWAFLKGPLLDGLYPEYWYNSRNYTNDEFGYILHENRLLGMARLRQVRVQNDSCIVPDDFQDSIHACYDEFASGVEDKHPFGLKNGSAWIYQTERELDGFQSGFSGQISSYGGDGFAQDLPNNRTAALAVIQDLMDNLWIDRGTRALFIDFTVYNANINLFCVVRLVAELPATGGVVPSWAFRTVKLIRYVAPADYFVLACEVIFVLFIIYYLIEEAIEIKKVRLKYFKSFWNILDIVVIIVAFCCIIFNVFRSNAVGSKLDSLLEDPDTFPDFTFLSYWQITFNSALAIMVFICWVKVFKYISFNKTMTQLSSTLSKCAKDLAGFAVMFFIFFLAFAQLGYLLFGTQVHGYSSFEMSTFTLFRLILGDFDFAALQQANRILGPAFFILYVFFVFFILLNMFLAIINDTYAEVKSDIADAKDEFEMGDYFKKGAFKMMERLNIKREKIVDIQNAMADGDMNADGILDFDEWRTNMKKRGYADAEIEAVFAKYDVDGDRGLSASEQRRMRAELDQEKVDLEGEYQQITDEQSGGGGDGVSSELANELKQRVEQVEQSVGGLEGKVTSVLVKLETIERAKAKRSAAIARLLENITQAGVVPDETQRAQMVRVIRDELLAEVDAATHAPTHTARPRSGRPRSGQE